MKTSKTMTGDTTSKNDVTRSMRPSAFDQVTSLLMSVMVLSALVTSTLALLWFLNRTTEPESDSVLARLTSGRAAPAVQTRDAEFETPAADEVTELAAETFAQVASEIKKAVAMVAAESTIDQAESDSNDDDVGKDGRGVGPGEGDDANDRDGDATRPNRWQMQFQAKDLAEYAKQLDHYAIELGLIGGGVAGVDYASEFTAAKPKVRHSDRSADEKRFYFMWVDASALRKFDKQLIQKAFADKPDVAKPDRLTLQFISLELERKLADLEKAAATKRGVEIDGIRKTIFQSVRKGDGFEFEVAQLDTIDR